jgi:hypothetical protein
MTRRCGDCQLCCKLLPVPPLNKGAGERCRFQRAHKGCTVYHTKRMPVACRVWSCRWLVNDDTDDLSRPDRAHYVLDISPDFVTMVDEAGERAVVEVVQVWVDPDYPDAHRDPALRAYLERRGKNQVVALVRWDNKRGMVIFPPALSRSGQWNEAYSGLSDSTHSPEDIAKALGCSIVVHVEIEPGAP